MVSTDAWRLPFAPLRAALFALVLFASASVAGEPGTGTGKRIMLVHYRNDMPSDELPYDRLTHISQLGVWPGIDGKPVLAPYQDRQGFTEKCEGNGVSPLLLVTNPGKHPGKTLYAMTRKAESRKRFCALLAEAVEINRYAGIDLDWEFPVGAAQIKAWNEFVIDIDKALRMRGGRHIVIVSLPVWGQKIPDRAAMETAIDYIDVMAYDFFGSTWGSRPGNHSPLNPEPGDPDRRSIKTFLSKWKTVPRSKIVIGLPFFGYTCYGLEPFRIIDRSRLAKTLDAYETEKSGKAFIDGGMAWSIVLKRIKNGWIREEHATVPSTWFYSPDRSCFIAADDPSVINVKTRWAIAEGYAGVFVWYFGADRDDEGGFPLFQAAWDGMTGGTPVAE